MEENENLENQEVNNENSEIEEQEVVTSTEYIDYSADIIEIKTDIKSINGNLTFIILLLILWCVLSNFVYKKGWTR